MPHRYSSWDALILQEFSDIHKTIFACLFSIHSVIELSRPEQVCFMRLYFKRYLPHHQAKYTSDGKSIFQKITSISILAHDIVNLL